MQKHARQSTGPAGDAGYSASSSQSDACSLRIDVEQPVPQLAQPLRAPPQPIRSAGDVFGTPGVVTRIMAYCATLEDVSRLSRTCRGAARAPWPPVAPWVCVASMIAEPRHRRRDEPAFGRRVAHALVMRIALPEAVRAAVVRAADAGAMQRAVNEASSRAAGIMAVRLAPATSSAWKTAAICIRAMAHAALAALLVGDGPMIAREAAASALTSLLRRVRSGPERAPRYTVLSDLSVRGFDTDFARIANEDAATATAVVRSAARSLSRALYPRTRALLSRARRDAL